MMQNLAGRLRIRLGVEGDIDACDTIAKAQEKRYPSSLGWVMKVSYIRKNHFFHVAEVDGIVRGFVLYSRPTRGANEGWSVVHALAVASDFERQGVGRNLLYSVPCPIRLKCPQTVGKEHLPNPANDFYRNAGFRLSGEEAGKHRRLNIYELKILCIFCAGGSVAPARASVQSGMAYGTRHDYKPALYPFMVDINWKKYDWEDYLNKISKWRPVQAMVADYEHPEQKELMLRQIQDLRDLGIMRIKVCPKFDGAVRDIPEDCIVAISVPSKYAGFLAKNVWEYTGRKIHLLGGTPMRQRELISHLNGVGAAVVSVDVNAHETAAKKGTHYEGGKWRNFGTPADYENTMIYSGKHIVSEMNAASDITQMPLWGDERA